MTKIMKRLMIYDLRLKNKNKINDVRLKKSIHKSLIVNLQSTQGGFTLVELLLYMGIFSILVGVLMQIFTAILATHFQSQASSSVDQDGSFIMSRITSDIHQASAIVLPTPGTTGTTLDLTINGIDEKYMLHNNSLCLSIGGTPCDTTNQMNSTNTQVSSISFKTIGNASSVSLPNPKRSVQVILTLTSSVVQTGGRKKTETFQTTVQIRPQP